MASEQRTLKFTRETKNTLLFEEKDSDGEKLSHRGGALLSSIYVHKSAFTSGQRPATIRVTVEI